MDPQQQPYNPNPVQPQAPPEQQPNLYGPSLPPPAPNAPFQSQMQPPLPPKTKSSKKVFIIGGVVAGIVVLAIIAVVIILSSNNKKPAPATEHHETTEAEGPQPATAVDIEHANNSISQDISGLNDDNDFPTEQLDDKSLKL